MILHSLFYLILKYFIHFFIGCSLIIRIKTIIAKIKESKVSISHPLFHVSNTATASSFSTFIPHLYKIHITDKKIKEIIPITLKRKPIYHIQKRLEKNIKEISSGKRFPATPIIIFPDFSTPITLQATYGKGNKQNSSTPPRQEQRQLCDLLREKTDKL